MANRISNSDAGPVINENGDRVENATVVAVKQEDVSKLYQKQASEIDSIAVLTDENGNFEFGEFELYNGENQYTVFAIEEGTELAGTPYYPHVDATPNFPDFFPDTKFVGNGDGEITSLDTNGNVNWVYNNQERIATSVAVYDGLVFFGAGNEILALNVGDGSIEWRKDLGDDVYASPCVIDGTLFTAPRDGEIYALNSSDGSEQWMTQITERVYSGIAYYDETLYIANTEGKLYAITANDGTKQWEFETGGGAYNAMPAVVGETVYCVGDNSKAYAVDATDGTKIWEFTAGDAIRSCPAVYDGTMYFGCTDEYLYALNADDGSSKWENKLRDRAYSSPFVLDGSVYISDIANEFYRIDVDEGDEDWRTGLDGTLYGVGAAIDGFIYAGLDEGQVFEIEISTGFTTEIVDTGERIDNSAMIGIHDGWSKPNRPGVLEGNKTPLNEL